MKSLTYVLAAILGGLTVSANVQANSVDHKLYAGLTLGRTFPFYTSTYKNTYDTVFETYNIGLLLGKDFSSWGFELNMMRINAGQYHIDGSLDLFDYNVLSATCNDQYIDDMFGVDAYYNFLRNGKFTCNVLAGVEVIRSKLKREIEICFRSHTDKSTTEYCQVKLAPKLGIGAQYALNESFTVAAYFNYVKPINHPHITDIIYATVGMNFYL